MGKQYTQEADGTIRFTSARKSGEVRIPNYVVDLYLPVLGAQTLGLYVLYCRLEREGSVKGITGKRIASLCRMGLTSRDAANKVLQELGFVEVKPPRGKDRLRHFTTEIVVLDPPNRISKAQMEKFAAAGYDMVCPWLVADAHIPEEVNEDSAVDVALPPANSGRSPAMQAYFDAWNRKRWSNRVQGVEFACVEEEVGEEAMIAAIKWAAVKGISDLQAIFTTARSIHKKASAPKPVEKEAVGGVWQRD